MKKLICICLALSILTGLLASCGISETSSNTDSEETVSDTPTITEETEETEETIGANLPKGLDLNGKSVRIKYQESDLFKFDVFLNEELNGELISDALYNRNIRTEDDLNVKLEWIPRDDTGDWHLFPMEVQNEILAGADFTDLVIFESRWLVDMAVNGYFRDLSKLPYIDLANPWWNGTLMKSLDFGEGRRYMLTGSNSLATFVYSSAALFNKDLFEMHFGDTNELYNLVEEHAWTLDKLLEYSSAAYVDNNGNNKWDVRDTVGCVTVGGVATSLARCAGLNYDTTDEEGNLAFDVYNEQVLEMVDKLNKLFWSGEASLHQAWNYNISGHFAEGKALFLFQNLQAYASDQMRSMENRYGVLPVPVLSEGMEYYSSTTPIVDFVPTTVPENNLDVIAAVLEKLAFEGHTRVIPAWYEIALKNKMADDKRDSDMIDIIYSTLNMSKFCVIFPTYFYYVIEDQATGESYSSYYASKQKSMLEEWDNILYPEKNE